MFPRSRLIYLIASRIPPSLPIGLWVVGLSYLFFLFLLLGHWIVWLKGCGVVVVTHTSNQKNNFSTNPDKQHNRTKPSDQPINQSTQSAVPARKLKQPTWPNSQEPQPTNQNSQPTKTKKTI